MKKLIALIIVNVLTTVRIIGVICLFPIYLKYGGAAAAYLAIACYMTDFIDGVIARKCKVSTFFGSAYDGVADKAFTVANLAVIFTITKFAIFPILAEIAIILIQTFRYHQNINVKSSKTGKLKTWVISLTVILVYLATDIEKLTFLSPDFIQNITSMNQTTLLGIMFVPLYIFEVLTLLSYLVFFKDFKFDHEIEVPKYDLPLKPATSLKNRWDNWCLLWFNNEFYEKYKDTSALKELKKQIKHKK